MPRRWRSKRGRRTWFVAGSLCALGVTLLCDNGVGVRWVSWDELARNWYPVG